MYTHMDTLSPPSTTTGTTDASSSFVSAPVPPPTIATTTTTTTLSSVRITIPTSSSFAKHTLEHHHHHNGGNNNNTPLIVGVVTPPADAADEEAYDEAFSASLDVEDIVLEDNHGTLANDDDDPIGLLLAEAAAAAVGDIMEESESIPNNNNIVIDYEDDDDDSNTFHHHNNNDLLELNSTNNSNSTIINNNNNTMMDKEKVGRWSEQEHRVFLEGLATYGKQWKTIAGWIGTRTVVQVRTHAQKYFQKMERSHKPNSSSTSATATTLKYNSNPSTVAAATRTSLNAGAKDPKSTTGKPVPSPPPRTSEGSNKQGGRVEKRKSSSLAGSRSHCSPRKRAHTRKHQLVDDATTTRVSVTMGETTAAVGLVPEEEEDSTITATSTMSTGIGNPLATFPVTSTTDVCVESCTTAPTLCKSSSSTGSDWSTISPNAVVNTNDVQYHSTTTTTDASVAVSFDLLAEDPLEWLIETDCSQQYLPESSLPLFPFLQDDEDDDDKLGLPQDDTDDDDEEHIQDERPDNAVASSDNVMMIKTDMVEDALLNNMVDANVTMQSLFLTAVEDRETTERQ